MQRNNTYDIAKCWAIVSVIVYHVINIIFYNQIIHSFIDTYFLALFFFISGLLVKDDKVKCKGWLKMKAVQLLIHSSVFSFSIGFIIIFLRVHQYGRRSLLMILNQVFGSYFRCFASC